MFGLWHWKHLDTRTSLPGPSGKPGGGLRCASAGSMARNTRRAARIYIRRILDEPYAAQEHVSAQQNEADEEPAHERGRGQVAADTLPDVHAEERGGEREE